jgi:hypothetical protein
LVNPNFSFSIYFFVLDYKIVNIPIGSPKITAVTNPPANPKAIGNGSPGKTPLFSSISKVIIEPIQMPTIDTSTGKKLAENLKNMAPVSIE